MSLLYNFWRIFPITILATLALLAHADDQAFGLSGLSGLSGSSPWEPRGSCQEFALTTSSYQFLDRPLCANVIDYAFYVPRGSSIEELNLQVEGALGDSRWNIFSAECRAAVLATVCASVFLRCIPDVDLANVSTWDLGPYEAVGVMNVALPFHRSCHSGCMRVYRSCSSMLGAYDLTPNCFAAVNFTYAAVSVTDDVSVASLPLISLFDIPAPAGRDHWFAPAPLPTCTFPEASQANLSEALEPYEAGGEGSCRGIAPREVYVFMEPPLAATEQPRLVLAPFRPQLEVQRYLENRISLFFDRLPSWLSQECSFSLRSLFCSSLLPAADTVSLRTVLEASFPGHSWEDISQMLRLSGLHAMATANVTVPSLPHREVCVAYRHACSRFISWMGALEAQMGELLAVNCSEVLLVQPGDGDGDGDGDSELAIELFPQREQAFVTLSSLVDPLSGNATTLVFPSRPTRLASAVDEVPFQPTCPFGFVPGMEPSNPLLEVAGTACIMGCM